jgi:hypothetical protein
VAPRQQVRRGIAGVHLFVYSMPEFWFSLRWFVLTIAFIGEYALICATP